ncbi:MAG: hypothetical protein ACYDAR_13265 [Thermomicrobiales bacterium]
MRGSDDWQSLMQAWLKDQPDHRDRITLDLNRDIILRNALPFTAPIDAHWWGNQTAQAETWHGQGWQVADTTGLSAGKIVFRRVESKMPAPNG